MSGSFFKRLGLFEGVLIGIYGNWLIAFLDKFSLSEPAPLVITEVLLILLVYATFLLFFAFSWLSSKPMSIAMIFGAIHITLVFLVSLLEEITRSTGGIRFWLFVMIGQGIFFLLVTHVVTKTEYEERFIEG
jgi:hypothetical protein